MCSLKGYSGAGHSVVAVTLLLASIRELLLCGTAMLGIC